jgi:FecR-like protein
MKPLAVLAAIAILFTGIAPVAAAPAKQLQNEKGSVFYQHPNGAPKQLAPQASIALSDNDYAITGDASLGAVTLPDSSRVLLASKTKVQLAFFNQAGIASAKFILFQGKTRFTVVHPAGAHANYTFSTPVAQIAVRGTEGDIDLTNDMLQVNVYQLDDPNLPVVVTLDNGQVYNVNACQSLTVRSFGQQRSSALQDLTDALRSIFDEFIPGDPCTPPVVRTQHHGFNMGWVLLPLFPLIMQLFNRNSEPQTITQPPPHPTPTPICGDSVIHKAALFRPSATGC